MRSSSTAAAIAAIVDRRDIPAGAEVIDLGGTSLVPGFIDTQVNGGGDRLFNDDPSVETIAAIGAAHRQFGTTGFLPTLISDDCAKIEAAIEAARAAIAAGVPGRARRAHRGPVPQRRAEGHPRRCQAETNLASAGDCAP